MLLIIACICICLFAVLALFYNEPMLQRVDEGAFQALFGNDIVTSFHYFGETVVVIVISIVFAAYCVWRKKHAEALFTLSTIAIGYGINQLLKRVVERPRPAIEDQLMSYSFPSAHTMASLLWIVTLLYVMTYTKKKGLAVVAAWTFGISIAVMTGLARVAEGRHFFTDVLAGWLLAAAWLLICMYVWQKQRGKSNCVK